jgi:hypothetical protein
MKACAAGFDLREETLGATALGALMNGRGLRSFGE